MAKGARSNHKKAVRTQRRINMKASWQDAADARRYEALAQAAASAPIDVPVFPQEENEGAAARGLEKPKRQRDAADMETDAAPASSSRKKKGVRVKGIQKKKHNNKKSSALWVSNFHKSKKGKEGFQ